MLTQSIFIFYDLCMGRRRSGPGFTLFLILLVVLGGVLGYAFFFTDYIDLTPSKKQVVSETGGATAVFDQAPEWVPEVVWGKPKSAEKQTYYGTVKGTEVTGKLVNREGYIDHPENPEFIKKLGFSEDPNLSADGPGSSMWGYIKHVGQNEQVILLSYTNEDMHPSAEGPLEANCPCTLDLSVFVSDKFKPNWQ